MGLFDRLRGRRQSEDALAQARAEAGAAGVEIAPIAAPVTSDSGEVIGAPIQQAGFGAEGIQIPGLENMGALGPMIQQAIASGNAQVINTPTEVINLAGADPGAARKAVLDVLAKHGIDAQAGSGQQIPVTNPQVAQDIFAALGKFGLDPKELGGAMGQPGAEPTPGT